MKAVDAVLTDERFQLRPHYGWNINEDENLVALIVMLLLAGNSTARADNNFTSTEIY